VGSAGRLQLVPYGGSKPRSASKRQPHLRRQSLALAADKMAQVFRCNFLWGHGVLHAFHGHRQKGINVISLDGECYTAAAARLDCDAAFMDRTPAHSSPMTHKAFQPFCLFYHSITHTHMVCHERRPLCSQFASGNYKMVVAQRGKIHGRPPFTGPSLENGKHMSLWLFRMSS